MGSTGALSSGALSFFGGTLQYSAVNTTDYSTRILSSGSAISIDTNGQNVTFASGLSSTNVGGLSKIGLGALTLTGSSSFSGSTTINGGTLAFNSTAANLGSSAGSTIFLNNGAAILMAGGSFNISHPVVLGSGGGVLLGTGDNGFNGAVTGGTGLTILSGDIIPNGPTSNIGTININGPVGTRLLTTAAFLANNATINVLGAGDVLSFNGSTGTFTNPINLASGTGILQRGGNVTLTNTPGQLNLPTAGQIDIGGDDAGGATMTINGALALTGDLTIGSNTRTTSNSVVTLNTNISGSGGLIISGRPH